MLRVRRRVRRTDRGGVDVDTPRTAASCRTVVLPAPLRDVLADHLDEYVGDDPDALVFATAHQTVPARSNLTEMLHRATKVAG